MTAICAAILGKSHLINSQLFDIPVIWKIQTTGTVGLW